MERVEQYCSCIRQLLTSKATLEQSSSHREIECQLIYDWQVKRSLFKPKLIQYFPNFPEGDFNHATDNLSSPPWRYRN